MNNPQSDASSRPVPSDNWLKPFENIFIGMTANAIIRHVIGSVDVPEQLAGRPLEGLSWQEFVTHFAAKDARDGLLTLWAAVGEGHVAPAYYPAVVPFKSGVIAELRVIENDPDIRYAIHLAPSLQCCLDTAIGVHTLNASKTLLQLSQSIFRGVYGPLTDSQVKTVGNIVALAETLDQFFNDLRVEVTAPATQAPMPHELAAIMGFTEQEFSTIRRISTHQLGLDIHLPASNRIYCYKSTHTVLKHIISTLFESLTARTRIVLSVEPQDDKDTVRTTISYHTTKPELLAKTALHPSELFAAERFQPTSLLRQILSRVQSHLSPINGRVWVEPVTDNSAYTMRINIVLPRWHD